MDADQRFCVNCTHYKTGWHGECHRLATTGRDLETGEPFAKGVREARAERFIPFVDATQEADRCGQAGKHFTPKIPIAKRRRVKARGLRFWRWLTNPFGQGTGDY